MTTHTFFWEWRTGERESVMLRGCMYSNFGFKGHEIMVDGGAISLSASTCSCMEMRDVHLLSLYCRFMSK